MGDHNLVHRGQKYDDTIKGWVADGQNGACRVVVSCSRLEKGTIQWRAQGLLLLGAKSLI